MKIIKSDILKLKADKLSAIRPILELDILSDSVWLAGGSLRTLVDKFDEVNDYDLFFKNPESVKSVKDKLVETGFELVYSCPNDFLLTFRKDSVKVQIICEEYYQSLENLLNEFDFTVTCAGTDGKFIYFTSDFVRHIRKKELHLSNLVFPVATFKRVVKYSAKGYKIKYVAKEFVETVSSKQFDGEELMEYID